MRTTFEWLFGTPEDCLADIEAWLSERAGKDEPDTTPGAPERRTTPRSPSDPYQDTEIDPTPPE